MPDSKQPTNPPTAGVLWADDSGTRPLTHIRWDRTLLRETVWQLQFAEPLVPTDVPTGLARLANQAPDLEPRYGIEP